MPSPVRMQKGFVVGTFPVIYKWWMDHAKVQNDEITIAPNTTIRYGIYDRYHHIIYRHFQTDIVYVGGHNEVTVNGSWMSKTTKARMNQFLEPFGIKIFTRRGTQYFTDGKEVKMFSTYHTFKV